MENLSLNEVLTALTVMKMLTPVVKKAGSAFCGGVTFVLSTVTDIFDSKTGFDKLQNSLAKIRGVLVEADKSGNHMTDWYSILNEAAMDAEDLIHEFETYVKVQSIVPAAATGSESSSSRKRKRHVKCPVWHHRWKMSRRIEELLEKQSRYNVEPPEQRQRIPETTHQVMRWPPSLRGNSAIKIPDQMEKKKNEILGLMKKTEFRRAVSGSGGGASSRGATNNSSPSTSSTVTCTQTGPPVIAIVGDEGMGKTTVARHVFDDPEVENYIKIWICVGRENDAGRIIKAIVELTEVPIYRASSTDSPQDRLKELINGRKFLLVLDDVRDVDDQFWNTLQEPLKFAAAGSAILLTTENEMMLRHAHGSETISSFSGLNSEDSMSLFHNQVFGADAVHDIFVEIGGRIVDKCNGWPLAIVSIGGLLYDKRREQEWRNILDNIDSIANSEYAAKSILEVSYKNLTCHLKQCFTFCSMFPYGYEFDKEELVRTWIALGLINKTETCNMSLEDVGYGYINSLLRISFFQVSVEQKYKIPDCIYQVAQSIDQNQCLKIQIDSNASVTMSSRYALFYGCEMENQLLRLINRNECCRALMSISKPIGTNGRSFPNEVFEKFRRLRVLDLRNNQLEEVPSSIGNLILLKYLNLSGTLINRLPDSLSNLYNLQVLELGDCQNLRVLPRELSNLTDLRHLGLHLDWENQELIDSFATPPQISRLALLRTLSRFAVSSESGCSIKELMKLNDIRGELCISKLENIVNVEDAKAAKLENKRNLKELMLRWTRTESDVSKNVHAKNLIEVLCPPGRLKCLWIMNYPGNTFPRWLAHPGLNIQTLRLSNCVKCVNIPLLGKLRELRNLYIEELNNVEDLGYVRCNDGIADFPLLETLVVSNMSRLARLFRSVDGDQLARLRKIVIENCPILDNVDGIPNSVGIDARNCPQLPSREISSDQHVYLRKNMLSM